MLPVIAIVGRPNVGKSTLFNVLTRSRNALVADEPGVTRDRQHGLVEAGRHRFVAVDTGGLRGAEDPLAVLIAGQALRAAEEADIIILVVDAQSGLLPADEEISRQLRATGLPLVVAANKADGGDAPAALAEFYRLGVEHSLAISAAHRRGIRTLLDTLIEVVADPALPAAEANTNAPGEDGPTRIAVLGRPNVGKSTLVNRLCGEERVIAHDLPGTTRDSVTVPFRHRSEDYELIDTAGIRRRARVHEKIEKFSVIKAIQAMQSAQVVVLVLDATEGITEQDLGLLGHIITSGRALCLAVNKWDAVDAEARRAVRLGLERRLSFIDYTRPVFISASRGRGLKGLMTDVRRGWESAQRKMPTPELTRILQEAIDHHPPPLIRGRRIKLRYAHQGGSSPPTVVIHGNQTDAVPASYKRYLSRCFREAFGLYGTPLTLQFRTGDNPYEGRRNKLTPRQQRRRKRLLKHAKR